MEKINPLGFEKESKLLAKFSIPAIIGMLVNALYNIVDRIYIGNAKEIGYNGIAGITIAFPIMIILLSFGLLFGIGGATFFSIKLGEGKNEEANWTLGNSFSLLLVFGILFLILGQLFLAPLLKFFGASETILPYASEYMKIIFWGAIFQIVSIGMNHFLRADGQPKLAMITMFMGAGVNIVLDPLFIYVFKMGMTGAALATILSQFLSMTWILIYFFGKRSNHKIRLKYMKPKLEFILKIITHGVPNFFMQLGNSLLNVVLNKTLLKYGGDIAISGMGVINSVQTLLLMPVIGLNQGLQPIVSFNYGAKKYSRIKNVEKIAIFTATIIVVTGWLVTRLFPKQIVSLFNRDAELLSFGSYALVTWFWCLPLTGFQIIAANFFQATGRPVSAMLLTLSRQILFLIPFVYILSMLWGIDGLLYAAPLADGISTIITGIWFIFNIRKLPQDGIEIKRAKKHL